MKISKFVLVLSFLTFLSAFSKVGAQISNFNINPTHLTGGLINTLTPSFTWDDVAGETGYFFSIIRVSDGVVVYHNSSLAANTTNHPVTTGGGLGWIVPHTTLVVGVEYQFMIQTNPPASSAQLTYTMMSLPPKPTLSDPANSAANQSVIKLFDWSDCGAGVTYTFQIDNAGDNFSSMHENTSGIGTSNHQVSPALAYAATYEWRVRASNAMGDGDWSDVFTFTTRLTPVAPSLLAPVNGITGVSIIPSFSWENVGASDYVLIIDDNSDFSSPLYNSSQGTNITKNFNASELRLNSGTLYYWRVIADGVASTDNHFTTVPAMIPVFDQPFHGAIAFNAATKFTWHLNQPIGGLTFILQYKQATADPLSEAFWSDATEVQTTNLYSDQSLVLGKTYYWRVLVRKTNPAVVPYNYIYYPAYNVYNRFSTTAGSSVDIYPSWPKDGTILYTNTPTLKWYLNMYAAGLVYQVAYGQNDDFDADGELQDEVGAIKYPADANIVASGISEFYYTPTLSPGRNYYWQVRSYYFLGDPDSDPTVGADGWSDWSPIEDFSTHGAGTVVQPHVAYPCNNILIYTTAPRLKWYLNEPTSAIRYIVDISTTSNFAALVQQHTTPYDQLYYDVTGLEAGATYYWRVWSQNAGGDLSAPSEAIAVEGCFTIQESSSSYAQPSYPLLVTDLQWTARPTLSWYLLGSSVGLDGYVVKWRKDAPPPGGDWAAYNDAGFTSTIGDINATSYTLTTDLDYGGHYYWAVACYDGPAFSTWHQAEFTVVGGTSMVDLQLDQPVNASIIFGTSVNLSWYVVGPAVGIDHYNIEYSYSDVYTPGTTTTSTTTNKTITNLELGASYWWRVQAVYADGSVAADWTTRNSFTVIPGASAIVQPQIGGPDNISVNTTSPMLSWYDPVKSPVTTSYELEISDNSDFTNSQVLTSNDPYMQVSDLKAGSNYFWKVRAKDNSNNYSHYSGIGEFNVSSVTSVKEAEIPVEFSLLQNYPNPFNPTTVIKYGLPENGFVTLKIYDMLGRELKTLVNQDLTSGNHSIMWNGDDDSGNKVSTGTYIYRITSGQNTVAKKMLLIK